MTKENVRRLHAHFKNMEENGHSGYPEKFQNTIKQKGKINRIELEAARPWLVKELEEQKKPKPKKEVESDGKK